MVQCGVLAFVVGMYARTGQWVFAAAAAFVLPIAVKTAVVCGNDIC
jgi:hypothetical protein